MAEIKIYDYTIIPEDERENPEWAEYEIEDPYSVKLSDVPSNGESSVIQQIMVECDGSVDNNSFMIEYDRQWFIVYKKRNLVTIVADNNYNNYERPGVVTFRHVGDADTYITLTLVQKKHDYGLSIGSSVQTDKYVDVLGNTVINKSNYDSLPLRDKTSDTVYVLESKYEIDSDNGQMVFPDFPEGTYQITGEKLKLYDGDVYYSLGFGVYVKDGLECEDGKSLADCILEYPYIIDNSDHLLESYAYIKASGNADRKKYTLVNLSSEQYSQIVYYPCTFVKGGEEISITEYLELSEEEREEYEVKPPQEDTVKVSSIDFFNLPEEHQMYYVSNRGYWDYLQKTEEGDRFFDIKTLFNEPESNEESVKEDYEMLIFFNSLNFVNGKYKSEAKEITVSVEGGSGNAEIESVSKLKKDVSILTSTDQNTDEGDKRYVNKYDHTSTISQDEYDKLVFYERDQHYDGNNVKYYGFYKYVEDEPYLNYLSYDDYKEETHKEDYFYFNFPSIMDYNTYNNTEYYDGDEGPRYVDIYSKVYNPKDTLKEDYTENIPMYNSLCYIDKWYEYDIIRTNDEYNQLIDNEKFCFEECYVLIKVSDKNDVVITQYEYESLPDEEKDLYEKKWKLRLVISTGEYLGLSENHSRIQDFYTYSNKDEYNLIPLDHIIGEYGYLHLSEEQKRLYIGKEYTYNSYDEAYIDLSDAEKSELQQSYKYIDNNEYGNLDEELKVYWTPIPYHLYEDTEVIVDYDNVFNIERSETNKNAWKISSLGDINGTEWVENPYDSNDKMLDRYYYRITFRHSDMLDVETSARIHFMKKELEPYAPPSGGPSHITPVIEHTENESAVAEDVVSEIILSTDHVTCGSGGETVAVPFTKTPSDLNVQCSFTSPFIKDAYVEGNCIYISVKKNEFGIERNGTVNVCCGSIFNVLGVITVKQEAYHD